MKKNICCGLGMALAFAAVAHAQDTYYKVTKVGSDENKSFDILLNNETVTEAKKGDWLYVSPIVPDGKMFKGYTLYDKYGDKAEEQVASTTEKKELQFLMPDHDVYVKASYESLRYYINAIKTEHGSVSYSFSDRMDIRDRTKPTFKVTVTPKADEGYKLSSIKVSRYLDAATTVTCAKTEGATPGASDGSCVFEMPYFDVDITATFVANSVDLPIVDLKDSKFKLTYELDGGKLPKDAAKSFACSEIAKLPTPTKEGFDFVGWSFENKLSNTYYALDRLDGTLCTDTTLYAIWTATGTCMEQTAIVIDGDAKSPVCSSNIKCALIHSNKADQDSVCNGVVWVTDMSILPSSSSVASSSSVESSSSEASSSSSIAESSSSEISSSSDTVVESSSSEVVVESSSATESSSSEKPASSSSDVEPSSSVTSASSSADVASSSSETPASSSTKDESSSSVTPSSSSEITVSSSSKTESSSSEKPASSSSKTDSSSSEKPASSSSKTESSSSTTPQNTYYKITKVGTEENQSFDILLNGKPITEAKQGDWPEIVPIAPEGKVFVSFTVYEKYGETEAEQVELKVGRNGLRFLMKNKDVYVKVTYGVPSSSSSTVESSSSAKPSSSSTKVESSSAAKPASSSVKAESSSAAKPASSSAKATSSSGKGEASSSSKAKSSSSAETVVESVKTEEDLPNCTEKREGVMYYVSDLKKILICKDKKWTKFDPNGLPTMARVVNFSAVVKGRQLQVSGAKVGSQVNLLDMQGRVMYSGKADAANFTMNLTRSGTFVLRIGTQQKVVNIR